jgi:hypothetical protein
MALPYLVLCEGKSALIQSKFRQKPSLNGDFRH